VYNPKLRSTSEDVVFRHMSIIGSLVSSNQLLREMLVFASTYGVNRITESFPPCQLNDLVERQRVGVGGKLIIDMGPVHPCS
jgi:propanol-preferring alcohol dehydrogenase